MNILQVLISLYAINGFIAVVGYWPQIIKLVKSTTKPEHFSMSGWSLWVYTTLITFLYAIFINGDKIFMLVSGMYFLGTFSIWFLIVYKNGKY